MAFNYSRKAGDKQYRIVSLMNDTISPWTDFTDPKVEYPEQCVLEVEHEDGSCTVEYERAIRTYSVGRNGNQLFLSRDVPIARMWLRSSCGMMYKVPAGLPERDGKIYILIPGGMQNVSLCGDIYFNKVYNLTIS